MSRSSVRKFLLIINTRHAPPAVGLILHRAYAAVRHCFAVIFQRMVLPRLFPAAFIVYRVNILSRNLPVRIRQITPRRFLVLFPLLSLSHFRSPPDFPLYKGNHHSATQRIGLKAAIAHPAMPIAHSKMAAFQLIMTIYQLRMTTAQVLKASAQVSEAFAQVLKVFAQVLKASAQVLKASAQVLKASAQVLKTSAQVFLVFAQVLEALAQLFLVFAQVFLDFAQA
jgi:hypothetical protein